MNLLERNPDTMNTFLVLDDAGHSAEQIAERLGVTPRTVTRWRRATGRLHRPATVKRPESTREQARRLVDDGCSFAEAARTVGVDPVTIRKWFPDAPAWSKREAGLYRQMLYGFQGRTDVRPFLVPGGAST